MLQTIVKIALVLSVVLTVFSIGLRASVGDAAYLLRDRSLLLRSLLAMDVVMPLFALAVLALTAIPVPARIALAALSVAPVPPLLPRRTSSVSSASTYTISLLGIAALLAIVFVPLAFAAMGHILGVRASVPVAKVALVILVTVLVPLTAGILVNRLWPQVALRIAHPLALGALVLMIASVLPVLVVVLPRAVALAHDGTIAAFAGFVIVGMIVGYFMGGPELENRYVLSIAASSRHPGLAAAVASASFPRQTMTIEAIALYLVVNIVLTLGLGLLRKRTRVRAAT